jgi:hypothetical protein
MKKFFGNLYIFLAVLLVSLAAVPWNDFSVWGLDFSFLSTLTTKEPLLKVGIIAVLFFFSFIFLLVSNHDYKKNKEVSKIAGFAATFPLIAVGIAFLINLGFLIYSEVDLSLGINVSNINSIFLIATGAAILLSILFSHLFSRAFRIVGNFGRFSFFVLFLFSAVAMGAINYYYVTYKMINYQAVDPTYMAIAVPAALVLYILHIIIVHKKGEEKIDEDLMYEEELDEVLVGENGLITSKSNQIDPSQDIYQEVHVDPEFSRQKKQRSKPNSIEYYIDKPKMFKPLNPTFDKLVNHVKDFPDVIAKSDDERITFYVARRPFLVLMNYGDYYRIIFRHELEEGIRLIIKYPTISKNKSSRDELWFKANNYGDLPKEIIYKIVKSAYDLIAK